MPNGTSETRNRKQGDNSGSWFLGTSFVFMSRLAFQQETCLKMTVWSVLRSICVYAPENKYPCKIFLKFFT
jgi:hypothetical protein